MCGAGIRPDLEAYGFEGKKGCLWSENRSECMTDSTALGEAADAKSTA